MVAKKACQRMSVKRYGQTKSHATKNVHYTTMCAGCKVVALDSKAFRSRAAGAQFQQKTLELRSPLSPGICGVFDNTNFKRLVG